MTWLDLTWNFFQLAMTCLNLTWLESKNRWLAHLWCVLEYFFVICYRKMIETYGFHCWIVENIAHCPPTRVEALYRKDSTNRWRCGSWAYCGRAVRAREASRDGVSVHVHVEAAMFDHDDEEKDISAWRGRCLSRGGCRRTMYVRLSRSRPTSWILALPLTRSKWLEWQAISKS